MQPIGFGQPLHLACCSISSCRDMDSGTLCYQGKVPGIPKVAEREEEGCCCDFGEYDVRTR